MPVQAPASRTVITSREIDVEIRFIAGFWKEGQEEDKKCKFKQDDILPGFRSILPFLHLETNGPLPLAMIVRRAMINELRHILIGR